MINLIIFLTITIPSVCDLLPDDEYICNPPPIEEMCYSMTNYWVFDESGNMFAGGGQSDSDPTSTANGYEIYSPEQAETFVAAPFDYVGNTFCTDWLGCIPIHDTFGNQTYQDGAFFHWSYHQYVIPIDVFSPEPIHYLDCTAKIK